MKIGVVRKPLTNKQYNQLFGYHPLTDLVLRTGVRLREVQRLINEYQDEQDYLDIHTKKSGRYKNRIYLTDNAIVNIKALAYLKGKEISTYKRLFKKISKQINIPFSAHHLRSTFATRLIDIGVDLVTVQTLMNHRSVEMTARYVVHSELTLRNAVECLENYTTIKGLSHPEAIKEILKKDRQIKRLERELARIKKKCIK